MVINLKVPDKPLSLKVQLQQFAESSRNIHQTIENDFYELEQRVIYHKNQPAIGANYHLLPSIKKNNNNG